MNRESSKPSEDSPSPSNKSTARAIRAHPSAQRDRSPVDHLRNESDQPAVGSPQLDAKAQDSLAGTEARGVPLNTKWTFWLDKSIPGATAAQYEANLRNLYTVSTVESFWCVFNNIPSPSLVACRYSYHLMRGVRRPIWEDDDNVNGGYWKLKVPKLHTATVWRELVLACIGEQFEEECFATDEVTGISVSVREREDLIQIWNGDSQHADKATIIQKVKKLVPHVQFLAVFYKAHKQHFAFEGNRARPQYHHRK